MPRLPRRALMRASAAALVGVGLGAVGCSTAPTARSERTPSVTAASPSATLTPTPTPFARADAPRPRPALQQSFGPNGTHYPDELPWLGDTAATDIVVECDWGSIGRALRALTAEQVAAGAVIRVKPGALSGGGGKSTSRPVLTWAGKPEWERNVLVCPRDGFGSVVVAAAGARFEQCARVSFFGFLSRGGFALTRCVRMQMGWSRWEWANITIGGADIALYEIVAGFRRNPEDTAGIRPSGAFPMLDLTRYGCLFGPSVKPAGSESHCDTLQLEGVGTGTFGPFTSVDCVDYGSSNSVTHFQPRLTRAEYRHCLILGGELPWRVFPLTDGDHVSAPNGFSGACLDVSLFDSVVSGPIGASTFTQVHNTAMSYAPQQAQQPTVAGGWTVDPAIASWSAEHIIGLQSTGHSDDELARLWQW